MLGIIEKVLAYELTIAEWIGLAIMINAPSVLVGTVVVAANADKVGGAPGLERVVKLVGALLCWPLLLLSSVCPA